MSTLYTATDTTFRTLVLRAALPALVCFYEPECAAAAALHPLLARLALAYNQRLAVAEVSSTERIGEQFGVTASPTVLVFRHGNEVLRSTGFLPEPLLRLLAEDALTADGEYSRLWSPLEDCFEKAVLLPLIDALGFAAERQHRILNWPGNTRNGRIDLLVHDQHGLITLIESKRALRSLGDLRAAAKQAQGYARAMHLPSFVVAAPLGLWVYALHGAQAVEAAVFSWIELGERPELLGEVVLRLRSA